MQILNRQDTGPMDATRYSKCTSAATMPLATDVSETFNVSTDVTFRACPRKRYPLKSDTTVVCSNLNA